MVGRRFEVGEATVKRWVALYRREGHVEPRSKGSGPRSTISLVELEALVTRLGDATANEITVAYNKGRRGKQRVHVSSIKRALQLVVIRRNDLPNDAGRPDGKSLHGQAGASLSVIRRRLDQILTIRPSGNRLTTHFRPLIASL
jgi:transposase-like protein